LNSGVCRIFGIDDEIPVAITHGDNWEGLCDGFGADWRPEFIVLDLAYAAIPDCLWSAPVPIIGLAPDWNLLWHYYRACLPLCDLVLTDSQGVEVMQRHGIRHARVANLFGCDSSWAPDAPTDAQRDIDILFVGNLHPAVQGDRLRWLGRIARMSGRWRVAIHQGVFGADYRSLLARARIIFNHSNRGECNKRTFEAAAAGALLFQEEENSETVDHFEMGRECVFYSEDNLEALLHHYLEQEDERRVIADAGHRRARQFTFARLWEHHLAGIEEEWPEIAVRASTRASSFEVRTSGLGARSTNLGLETRLWEALCARRPEVGDLVRELGAKAVAQPHNGHWQYALGLATYLQEGQTPWAESSESWRAREYFQRAVALDPTHAVAGLGAAEALAIAGQKDEAIAAARKVLDGLADEGQGGRPQGLPGWLNAPTFPPRYDHLRVEWEKAAWENAAQPDEEARAKLQLLRWRLHSLLADLTEATEQAYEAALARPDLPTTRAGLGCALRRAGRPAQAVPHLRAALDKNPFDVPTARLLFQALGEAGDGLGQRRVARDYRLLAKAAPGVISAEAWIQQVPPPGDELTSIIILCCNGLEYTKLCLESVLRHTRSPYELILIDNGSTDGTAQYLEYLKTEKERGEFRRRSATVTLGLSGFGLGSNSERRSLKSDTTSDLSQEFDPLDSGPDRIVITRNEANLGFARGCNQGLTRARGDYLVFLNNDTVVTARWMEGLVRWALHDWPEVGMVGAVTNYSAAPQQVPVGYRELNDMPAFAASRGRQYAGRALDFGRLTGFCLLARRDVLQRVGKFDERYGLGFFEDDDLCTRVREAGFRLLVALDVFIHHFGSRTFAGLGINCRQQLQTNFELYKSKWGEDRATAYRLAEGCIAGQAVTVDPQPTDFNLQTPIVDPSPHAGGQTSRAPRAFPLGSRMSVSLTMIVKNEEANLAACLEAVRDLCAEIVIVDTGSSDRTKEIAAGFGARVFDFPWIDSFSAARNEALNQARGQWAFWLDADDRIDERARIGLRKLFAHLEDENVAYAMKCSCASQPGQTGQTVVDHIRLFRNNPEIRWKYRVHEQILPAIRAVGGTVRWADVVIRHEGYRDSALRQSKLDRDLRLLQLQDADNPDDPFTLFNLGSIYLEREQPREALPRLRRSLERSHTADSIVRKLFVLIVQAHRQLGDPAAALAECKVGRAVYPDDAELLFQEAIVLHQEKQLAAAIANYLSLLAGNDSAHFASVDSGLGGYPARHNLAVIYMGQGRAAEAEAQWRASLAEEPDFGPSWLGIGELCWRQRRWSDLEEVLQHLENGSGMSEEAADVRRRLESARA
jgi:GT2 family glycosyltransferase